MNARIEVMIASRELEERPADDGEVLGLWRKAVATEADSRVAGLGAGSAFVLAYQGALLAATAVVRAAGYRVRETPKGHHWLTFAALAALGVERLSESGRRLNELRLGRHDALYDWRSETDAATLAELRAVTGRLFPAAREWLRARRPALAEALAPP